ncbi:MAG: sulfite exporter TauE/SafE family protein [Chloroflexi bacterium]|nr:sulfite exporter TauE/SafE family protein [Chloroflexota bacterium]
MDTLSGEQLLLVAAIVLGGALVFCTVGFGIVVASFPLLFLLLDPQTAVVVVNTVSLLMFSLVIWQTRQHIPARQVLPIAAAGIVGVPVGIFILKDADTAFLRISIAGLIIALTLLAAFNTRWALPKSTPVGLCAGFVVSVLLNAFGVGGALMVLAWMSHRMTSHALRGSLSLYFLAVEGAGVIGYGAAGLLTQERLLLIGVAALPVVMGWGLALLILRRINEVMFRRLVVGAIITTSMMVLVREAFSLL